MRQVLLVFLLLNISAAFACEGIHDFRFTTLEGNKVDLCEYQDRPIMVVNTASKCGFTPQFEKLESMYRKYQDEGLLIVGFPSNDFQQELPSNKEIGDFCKQTYGVQFPMAEKSAVTGPEANELYKKLVQVTHEPPLWNFHKYLILPDGRVLAFNSDTAPDSPRIMRKLHPYLK